MLRILHNIETRGEDCHRRLLRPTAESVHDIEHELVDLQSALQEISRRAPPIVQRKEAVRRTLDDIQGRLLQVQAMFAPPRGTESGPCLFDSGTD